MKISRLLFHTVPVVLAILAVSLLSGCLEFAGQSLTYRYDAATDTMRIFQCYKGIVGGEKPEALSDDEMTQLDSVLTGQRTFFFANWIFEFNRAQVREALANLKQPDKNPKLDAETIARTEKLTNLALDNVTVKNGSFYLEDGKLCGVQEVTIKNFSKIVAAANASIPDFYKSLAADDNRTTEAREFFLKAANSPKEYLKLNGNQIAIRMPMLAEEFNQMFGPESESAKAVARFKRGGGKLSYEKGELAITVGDPAAKSVNVSLPVFETEYSSNVRDALKKKGTKILESFDAEKAAKEFLSK